MTPSEAAKTTSPNMQTPPEDDARNSQPTQYMAALHQADLFSMKLLCHLNGDPEQADAITDDNEEEAPDGPFDVIVDPDLYHLRVFYGPTSCIMVIEDPPRVLPELAYTILRILGLQAADPGPFGLRGTIQRVHPNDFITQLSMHPHTRSSQLYTHLYSPLNTSELWDTALNEGLLASATHNCDHGMCPSASNPV